MKPLKEQISITIDSDVLEKARAESERCDRSLSQFINIILKDYLNSDEKPESLKSTLEGR
ncbi:MAG: toxin-antitoxin system protein [Clostridia bacterium]|nr:toxin-antitoxin system protein [Clostridia bacterium]